MSTKAKKPKTEREWSAYRCQLQCEVIRDALKNPGRPDSTAERSIQYALYGLAGAISDLSKQMEAK